MSEVSTGSIVKSAVFGVAGPALAASFTWVDFEPVDVDIQWSGLGFLSGDEAKLATDVGAAINPLGWIVVAAMAVAAALLIGSIYTRPLLLRSAAIAFGGVGLAHSATPFTPSASARSTSGPSSTRPGSGPRSG